MQGAEQPDLLTARGFTRTLDRPYSLRSGSRRLRVFQRST